MRLIAGVIAGLALTPIFVPAQNVQPSRFEPVTDRDLSGDPRLAHSVSAAYARVYVGDLATRLQEQSGVDIAADTASGASDRRVLISVRDRPAWKVMSALASLLSYRLALWQWERRYLDGVAQYRLVRTRGAQALPARLNDEAQNELERLTAEAISASRRSHDEWLARLADPTPVSVEERAGWGLQVFATALPEDVQKAVLRGETRAKLPVDELPAFGRRLVEDLYRSMRPQTRRADGEITPAPMPTEIVADTSRGRGPTASLFLEMGSMGGYSYSGGLPLANAFRARLEHMWIGDGDRKSNEAEESRAMSVGVRHELAKALLRYDPRWVELAERTDVPVLALAPTGRDSASFASDRVFSLRDYLGALVSRDYAIHKWRHDMLLITYAGWFRESQEVHACPWEAVRALRKACTDNEGLPPLDVLIRLAADLTPEQLQTLSDDWKPAESLIPIRGLLTAINRDDGLRTKLVTSGTLTLRGRPAGSLASGVSHVPADRVASLLVRATVVRTDGGHHLVITALFRDAQENNLGGWTARFSPLLP